MKTLLLTSFLFLSLFSFSQVSYVDRIEFDLADGFDNEQTLLFGEQGFLMTFKNNTAVKGMVEWKYDKFDSNLELALTKKIQLSKKLRTDESYTTNERTHTFYKDKSGNFSLVTAEATNLKITKVNGELPHKAIVTEMVVVDDNAVFNGLVKKKPVIFKINWKTGKTSMIPIAIEGFNPSRLFIENFQILKESKEVLVFVRAKISKNETKMFLVNLGKDGNSTKTFDLTKHAEGKNITSISAAKISNGNYVYTGTYSSSSSSSSEGLFFAEGSKDGLRFMKFYNFLDFDDFLSYLPEKRQKKIEKKQKKKEAKGKEYAINFRIADHNIIEKEDGYVFLGEAYYPTYRTETYTTTSTVNGVTTTTTHTRQVFDGYQYTHAVIAKFDKQGALVWDKTFSMWQAYKPFYVKRFIQVAEEGASDINLVFASGGSINSKSFNTETGEAKKSEQSARIETVFKGDEVKRSFSNIDYWYDNYFLAHGYQKIKNKENKNVNRKRKVFFFSKVKY